MIRKIKNYLLVALLGLSLGAVAVPATTSAACSTIANNVQKGANGATGTNSTCDDGAGVNNDSISSLGSKIVTTFSIVVGIISIIMIIYGGFRYITSGGDSGKVGNAKNSLIYAIVGLIIVALAQVIVHFVLNQTSNVGTP